jgi:hypothetical protein
MYVDKKAVFLGKAAFLCSVLRDNTVFDCRISLVDTLVDYLGQANYANRSSLLQPATPSAVKPASLERTFVLTNPQSPCISAKRNLFWLLFRILDARNHTQPHDRA